MVAERFETDQQNKEQQSRASAEEKRRRALPEVGSAEAEAQGKKPSLPVEWRTLTPLIEAHRSRRPTAEYLDTFWSRLRPRILRIIRQDQLVREYLRRTFWKRWIIRAAAVLALAALALSWNAERRKGERMNQRLTQLEQQLRASDPAK
jgi:hypothetical protein